MTTRMKLEKAEVVKAVAKWLDQKIANEQGGELKVRIMPLRYVKPMTRKDAASIGHFYEIRLVEEKSIYFKRVGAPEI